MKIKTEVLKRALQRVKNFTGNNSLVEIFNHVYLKTENSYLYLYASDAPASIKTKVCKADSNKEVNSIVKSKRLVDRKSTRLNSSHVAISYAVFCLKKKNTPDNITK